MSEKINISQRENPNSLDLEKERKIEQYEQINQTRLMCEQDACENIELLKKGNLTVQESNKYKAYFELDEAIVSDIERNMEQTERDTGQELKNSCRYDEYDNDILVKSAYFYRDRLESLKQATNNQNIDNNFIHAIVDYASAVEHDNNSTLANRYDDIKYRQQYKQNCQRRRSNCHNKMIDQINNLNDLANESNVKPFTYRNFVKNSVVNDHSNTTQMYHDRVTVAHFVAEMIDMNSDRGLPDSESIETT